MLDSNNRPRIKAEAEVTELKEKERKLVADVHGSTRIDTDGALEMSSSPGEISWKLNGGKTDLFCSKLARSQTTARQVRNWLHQIERADQGRTRIATRDM